MKNKCNTFFSHSDDSPDSIELRQWATRILSATTLEEKLFSPKSLTDFNPGAAKIWKEPKRPPGMGFKKRTKSEKLPPFHEHGSESKRAICLHRFAGHELLAVEMMASALLRFPSAPTHFRKGVAHTLKEEQGHVRLYLNRMQALGVTLEDLPLYRHFWCHTPYLTTPISFIAAMNLTFEMANLDFAPMYGKSFERFGDHASAAIMKQIVKDEISHVAFGWKWFKKFKTNTATDWEVWKKNLSPLLTPKRARGFIFNTDNRLQAGVSKEFIHSLQSL